MSAQDSNLAVNWGDAGSAILVVILVLGYIGFTFTNIVYQAWRSGVAASGGWNWFNVGLTDLVLFGVLVSFFLKIYRDVNTKITADALVQPSLSGLKVINWMDVTDLKVVNGVGYHVFSGKKRIVVAPYIYLKPNDVIKLISEKIEEGANKKL